MHSSSPTDHPWPTLSDSSEDEQAKRQDAPQFTPGTGQRTPGSGGGCERMAAKRRPTEKTKARTTAQRNRDRTVAKKEKEREEREEREPKGRGNVRAKSEVSPDDDGSDEEEGGEEQDDGSEEQEEDESEGDKSEEEEEIENDTPNSSKRTLATAFPDDESRSDDNKPFS